MEHKAQDRRLRKPSTCISQNREEISVLDHSIEIKWTEPVLLAFYTNSLVPRLIQPGSREQYHDPGHISSLMRMSETVRYATMACSAMSLCGNFSKDPNWNRGMRRQALSYQASAIKSIQAQIKAGVVDGTEDWLLLAATKLHLTDTLDHNTTNPIAHMQSLMILLRCRHIARLQLPKDSPPPKESLIQERICYEAALCHAITLMLFDRDFDMIDQPWWFVVDEYFQSTLLSTAFSEKCWPILGMPYELFRLALLAHSLNRRCALSSKDKDTAVDALVELEMWNGHIPHIGKFAAGYTWLIATTALLRHVLSRGGNDMPETPKEPKVDIQDVVTNLDAGGYFVRFPLWPLAVLYRVTEVPSEREVLKGLISNALRNVSCSASRPPPREVVNLYLIAPGL
ncbi:uncharacterized protein PAC_03788 [Phialocephala subalpina]|uniref:Uncharacterized protein n=1 Tax=Phialocephala subalpina TaxID=576137 RepID=A0A1L7WMD0_9HELO|nr:uncharacterized protein PAC_03788 [Phialocephala subalpina]